MHETVANLNFVRVKSVYLLHIKKYTSYSWYTEWKWFLICIFSTFVVNVSMIFSAYGES